MPGTESRFVVSMLSVFVLSLLLSLRGGGIRPVAAQQGTPATVTFPVSPDAVDCTVDARPLADFEQLLLVTPTSAQTNPIPFAIPEGVAADATTVSGVTATLLELYACYQAGDPRRFHALFTEEGLQRAFPPGMLSQEFIDEFFAASPVPIEDPDQRATILAIESVTQLPDGRVGAIVRSDEPEFGGLWTVYWVFIQVGDRFLVDDVILDVPIDGSAPEVSTPAP